MAHFPGKHRKVSVFYDTPRFLRRVVVLDGAWASGDRNGVLEVLAGLMRLIVQTALGGGGTSCLLCALNTRAQHHQVCLVGDTSSLCHSLQHKSTPCKWYSVSGIISYVESSGAFRYPSVV